MSLSPADFAAYSRATGTPYPESPQERAQMVPEVRAFRAGQIQQGESGGENNLLAGIGIGLGLLGAAGTGLALRGRRIPKMDPSGKGGIKVQANPSADKILNQVAGDKKISIIFGREDRGLTNEELQLANEHLIIPADTDYPVLNLAMSVQLVCYEIHMALKSDQNFSWQDYPEYTHQEIDNLIEHFNETAFKLGLVDKSNPKQILTRMERMFRRLHPDKMEGNFLRGFLTKVNKLLK